MGQAIEIKRSKKFEQQLKSMDKILDALILEESDKSSLIKLMVAIINEAEKTAYLQGFETATKLLKDVNGA